MPCYDERNSPSYINEHEIKPLQARNDLLARMLCGLLTKMDHNDRAKYLNQVPGLVAWWVEHQEHDRRREAAERRQKEFEKQQDESRLAALAKKLGRKII